MFADIWGQNELTSAMVFTECATLCVSLYDLCWVARGLSISTIFLSHIKHDIRSLSSPSEKVEWIVPCPVVVFQQELDVIQVNKGCNSSSFF